jgi:ketosteroid isomerase-like protein
MTVGILGTIVLAAAVMQDATIPAAARQAIAETNAAWLAAMKRQDAAAIYGDEAVFVTATGETLRGRTAIEHFERERFTATGRVLDGTIEDDGLARSGRFVYEWGHATLRVERSDASTSKRTVTGHFLTVWSVDSSGRWRIIRNLSLP